MFIPTLLGFVTLEIVCRLLEPHEEAFLPSESYLPMPEPKKEGEKRIIFFGASTVAGMPFPIVGFFEQLIFYLPLTTPDSRIQLVNRALSARNSTFVLRKLIQSLDVDEPDALVVLISHNEFIELQDLTVEEFSARYTLRSNLYKFALTRSMRRFYLRYLLNYRAEQLMQDQRSQFVRGSAMFNDRIFVYQENMKRIVVAAQQAGVPLYLCTDVSNLLNFRPQNQTYATEDLRHRFDELLGKIDSEIRKNRPEEAIREAEKAFTEFPDNAILYFFQGDAYLKLGDLNNARRCYVRAKDLDPNILRGLSVFNDIVRELSHQPGVHLVDIEEVFFQESKVGIPGDDLMYDYCHPNIIGHYLIAKSLMTKFVETGLFPARSDYRERMDYKAFVKTITNPEYPALEQMLQMEVGSHLKN